MITKTFTEKPSFESLAGPQGSLSRLGARICGAAALICASVFSGIAQTPVAIPASENAFVNRGGAAAVQTGTLLLTQRLNDANARIAYLRFDLASFLESHAAEDLTSATLSVFLVSANNAGTPELRVYGLRNANVDGVSDSEWAQSALTWNTQPARTAAPNDIPSSATALPNENTTALLGSQTYTAVSGDILTLVTVELNVALLREFLEGDNNQQITLIFHNQQGSAIISRWASLQHTGGHPVPTLELLAPISGAPRITDLTPENGTPFHPAASGLQFNVVTTEAAQLENAQIQLFLNGVDVSSQLNVTATSSTSRAVSFNQLQANTFYVAEAVAQNTEGRASRTWAFDTIDEGAARIIEAEDFNFSGGNYINNPQPTMDFEGPNSYWGQGYTTGVQGVDFNELNPTLRPADGSEWRHFGFADLPQTTPNTDFLRQRYQGEGLAADFDTFNIVAGEWLNYTRDFTQANYRVYVRARSGANQTVQLHRVTSDRTQADQSTVWLGDFNIASSGASHAYSQLVDPEGTEVILTLSGTQTVRLTALGANNNLSLNYILFVPTTDPGTPIGPYVASTTPADGATNASRTSLAATIINRERLVVPGSVELRINDQPVSGVAATPTATGAEVNHTFAQPLAPSAEHTAELRFQDTLGDSYSYGWSFTTIGLVAPSVSITSPQHRAQFSSGASVTIEASVTDSDSASHVVEFFVDGVKRGEDNSAPYSITVPGLANGTYLLSAVATDDTELSGTSEGVSIRVGAPPAGLDIAWVTFHPANNTPSDLAGGVGFTQAPDIGYVTLLEANGHTVTRFVTVNNLSEQDVALLNTFDLVIIGRSVDSAHYGDGEAAAERAAWHGITAPVINMNGYTTRSTRLGFMTGATIPDITGNIRLTAANPSHPIFDGVALTEANVMLGNFAGIVTALVNGTETTQRGISVNTDPLAGGGTVLAAIAGAAGALANATIIAEWPAGATLHNGEVLAARRMVFFSGSREQASGANAQIAGVFDLFPAGERMFLNAIDYITSEQQAAPRFDSVVVNANGSVTLTWSGGGVLQSTPALSPSDWTPVAGATSPYTTPAEGSSRFYRVLAP